MPQSTGAFPIASVNPSADMEALRTKIYQLEKEAAATQRHMEMQQRFVQQEAERKIEQMAQKNEMEKRDVQMRSDKLEAKAEMDKRDAQAKAAMDKRDVQVKCAKLEAKTEKQETALENEKKDRLVQQQITQLRWEARPGQTPQLVYGSLPPPVMPVAAAPAAPAAPAPTSYILAAPSPSPAPAQPSYTPQQNIPAANNAVLSPTHLVSTSPPPHRPPQKHTLPKNRPQPSGAETSVEKIGQQKNTQEAEPTKPSSQSALTTLPSSPVEAEAAAAAAAAVVTPTAMSVTLLSSKPEKPPLPLQQQPPLQQHSSSPPFSKPPSVSARPAQQQQSHHSNKAPVSTGAVPLPDGAQSHFFLSHAQSTGGDQTNAIYLELRQLGFTCW
jgi:hypothetical protein